MSKAFGLKRRSRPCWKKGRKKSGKVIGWALLSLSLVAGAAGGWLWLLSPGYPAWQARLKSIFLGKLKLKQVVVKGTRRLTPDQILEWASLEGSPTRGAPSWRVRDLDLWQIDLKEMASRLKRHPWIEAVAIERVLPDRLTLTIRERIAWARLEGPPSYLVSGEGMVLQRISEGEVGPPLPRLVGWGGHSYLPGERIGKAEILGALEILKDAGRCPWALQQGILQVDLSQRERPIITLGNGRKLRFGPTDIRGSWARLQTVSSRIEGASGMIDLSFKDLVVVGSFLSQGMKNEK